MQEEVHLHWLRNKIFAIEEHVWPAIHGCPFFCQYWGLFSIHWSRSSNVKVTTAYDTFDTESLSLNESYCRNSPVSIIHRLLDSLVVECWLRVRELPGSIPSQGPRHTKDAIKMVPVVPLYSTQHWKGKYWLFLKN